MYSENFYGLCKIPCLRQHMTELMDHQQHCGHLPGKKLKKVTGKTNLIKKYDMSTVTVTLLRPTQGPPSPNLGLGAEILAQKVGHPSKPVGKPPKCGFRCILTF